jgi:hypothetical protein
MRYLSFDIGKAKEDPTSIFRHPRDVLCVVNLRDEERLDILERWHEQLLDDTETPILELRALIDGVERAIGEVLGRVDPSAMPLNPRSPGLLWQ